MFDPSQLLGALSQGGLSNLGGKRFENVLSSKGLGDLLSSAQGQGGILGNLGGLLGNVLDKQGSGVGSAAFGGILGGMLGGDGVGGAAKGGTLAVLGMLAFNALRNHLSKADEAPSPQTALMAGLREPDSEEEVRQQQEVALLAIQAMINAAKADGQIDATEMQQILGRLQQAGIEEEGLDYVRLRMAEPMDTDSLVAAANDPQLAAQIYGASLLAIRVDSQAERDYLATLAQRLQLPEAVKADLDAHLIS
jgi:uncharacterized membrane protein YebE (DUF533 family)